MRYYYRPRQQTLLFLAVSMVVLIATITTSTTTTAAAANDDSHDGVVETLIEWVRSKGGIFNAKLEIRPVNNNNNNNDDSSFRLGVFAKEKIRAKELLLAIPPDCLITAGKEPVTTTKKPVTMECDTVRHLMQEMKLGDDSEMEPYVTYLSSLLRIGQSSLPSAWSKAGRELLLELLGVTSSSDDQLLPPYEAVDLMEDWYDNCNGSTAPLAKQAAMLVVQYGWEGVLIPIYDMMSHRNGYRLNTETKSIRGSSRRRSNGEETTTIKVRASRSIDAGEEIYNTRNFCADCGKLANTYGTPQIFRDHGVIEDYPQRWIFHEYKMAFELDEKINNDGTPSGELEISWIDGKEPSEEAIRFLQQQLRRLKEFAEVELEFPDEKVPKKEWDVIWQYHEALMVAMTHAIEAALDDDEDVEKCLDGEGACAVISSLERYDTLEEIVDDEYHGTNVCDMNYNFPEYKFVEQVDSHYQDISFFQDPKSKDMCFDLDNTVQICGSYRPQYHEMMVHYAARFLDNVKRVVFVGGGDSMLLHEVIKYPSLELVVGLELDQKVTRHSFKNFGTQPHWDNEKVEWWFGDATKSLLMLPKDYFESFDLVLVDLSETVMSFSVTKELDVMEALALLLKPDGVFVKNEMYLEKLSDIFDYTIQVHFYGVPIICSQALNMASNKVDFLYDDLKDHNVESLFLEPLNQTKDRYEIFHDYRKNNTAVHRDCKEHDEQEEEPIEQEKSPGILMIVEAENTTAELEPSNTVKDFLVKALKNEGLTVVSTVVPTKSNINRTVAVAILNVGYVVARTWPEYKYCAFDIHLWSSFEKHEAIKKALLAAVGSSSGSSSSYRIVAGGMFGVSTWKNDEKNHGPRLTKTCDSDRPAGSVRHALSDQSAVDIVLEESMSLVQDSDIVVAVLCGDKTQSCRSIEVLDTNDSVREVITLLTCPNIKDGTEYAKDGSRRMIACEKDVLKTLKASLTEGKKLSAIIIDSSAPYAMGQIVHKVFNSRRNKARMLKPNITMVMAPMLDETETWRRSLLERFRKDIITYDPVFKAQVLFNSSDSSMEMGVTLSGDQDFFKHLVDVTASIEKRTGLVSDVRDIRAGLWNWMDYVPKVSFVPEHYDQSSPLEQWTSQQPLGHQTVFQLEIQGDEEDDKVLPTTTQQVKYALARTVAWMKIGDKAVTAELHDFTNVGDGCVLVALWSGGNAIVLWDGKVHIDINLFTYMESVEAANEFVNHFKSHVPKLETVLRDEQPRGVGRVVNFLKDVEPRVDPHWA